MFSVTAAAEETPNPAYGQGQRVARNDQVQQFEDFNFPSQFKDYNNNNSAQKTAPAYQRGRIRAVYL